MPDMLTRRKVLLSKVEAVKGTDAAPVVASDLIVTMGDFVIAVPTEKDRGEGELKGTFGPGLGVVTKQSMSLEASARVRGLGQGVGALVTPMIHPLLMGSGHSVVTAGDGSATPRSATYSPTSVAANLKSLTDYAYEDGLLYKMLGSVCNLSFEAAMAALTAKSTLQSKYTVPTVVGLPAFTLPTQKIFRMTSALCVVTKDAVAINIGAFNFDCGVKVEEANETGQFFFEVSDRDPIVTIDPKAVATAAEWDALTLATTLALIATFTNELGETLVFTGPKAERDEVTSGNRAGRITRPLKLSLKEGAAGDDQYTIKWTGVL